MSLHIEDLTVHYQTLSGEVEVLDEVSLNVPDGEILGIAGESGCGKTTLVNALIRLVPPMKIIGGKVELDGVQLPVGNFEAMNKHRLKDLAIIPQYAMSAMNPTRKIGRMISELMEARGVNVKKAMDDLNTRLDLVNLSRDVLTMYPIELSGGMKQRMVMVLSTLLNPSLLIADEITSALDVSTQKAVAEMLVGFRDREFVKSIIFISHDVSILYQVADTILIMYAGQLAEKASTRTIISNPKHPYTKMLIGSLPKVGVKYENKKLQGIPGSPPLLINPPVGCRFRDRCPLAFEKCVETPPFREVEPGRSVACWKVMEDYGQG
ncbi:MAG: ABC transporter ATP-binding protein [Spirochaetota bacterium]